MEEIKILGVKLNKIDLEGAIAIVSDWLETTGQHTLFTVNPEFVMAAQKNQQFKEILNSSGLNICDGAGTAWAGKFLAGQQLTRVTGVELVEKLLVSLPGLKIYLLGGKEGSAESLMAKYPISIVGADSSVKLKSDYLEVENNTETLEKINQSQANVLLVAFGQVKQETWINTNLSKLPNVKVVIGVGGTFDYLSGQVRRAPSSIRALGLEWLFRLITEPQRFTRIWNATAKFSWLVFKEKWFNKV